VRRIIILISLLVLLMVPFITSCEAGDLNVLVNYAKMWALVHGITDDDGHVSPGAAGRFIAKDTILDAFGLTTTGDEVGDSVIDSARTVKDVRDAQKEATQGWNDLYSGKDVPTVVLPHYNNAVKTRPNDWSYLNERGIAHLMDLNGYKSDEAAEKDFKAAGDMTFDHPWIYENVYKDRAAKLEKLVQHRDEVYHAVPKRLYTALSDTYSVLYNRTGWDHYKQLQQQVDTKLREYQ
jgi:hypothetical protein